MNEVHRFAQRRPAERKNVICCGIHLHISKVQEAQHLTLSRSQFVDIFPPDLIVCCYTYLGFLALHGQRRSRTFLDGAFRSECRLLTQYVLSLPSITVYIICELISSSTPHNSPRRPRHLTLHADRRFPHRPLWRPIMPTMTT